MNCRLELGRAGTAHSGFEMRFHSLTAAQKRIVEGRCMASDSIESKGDNKRKYHREYQRKYRKTAESKQYQRQYQREYARKRRQSPEYRKYQREYRQRLAAATRNNNAGGRRPRQRQKRRKLRRRRSGANSRGHFFGASAEAMRRSESARRTHCPARRCAVRGRR